MTEDMVNHPSHYTDGPIECYEITKYLDFTTGNMVKYLYRWKTKGHPEEDLQKALWYSLRINIQKARYSITHNPVLQERLQLLKDANWMSIENIWQEICNGAFDELQVDLQLLIYSEFYFTK